MRNLKRILAVFLVLLMCGQSFAAVVSDNDGSAFITKAEFDSLKNNFQAQIDNYNNSIDSKIDGAIAGYLSGISLSQNFVLYLTPSSETTFKNELGYESFRNDTGNINLTHSRLAGCYGLTGVSVSTGQTYNWGDTASSYKYLNIKSSQENWTDNTSKTRWSNIGNYLTYTWSNKKSSEYPHTIAVGFNSTPKSFENTSTIDTTNTAIIKQYIASKLSSDGWEDENLTPMVWASIIVNAIASTLLPEKCKILRGQCYNGSSYLNWYAMGTGSSAGTFAPELGRKNTDNLYNITDNSLYGTGWGVTLEQGVPYINNYYKKISIINSFDLQNFTYKDASTTTGSSTGWDDNSTTNLDCFPTMTFERQVVGTKLAFNTNSTTASGYSAFQASQLRIIDNEPWTSLTQLGTIINTPTLKCFNSDCVMEDSQQYTINPSEIKYNRVGYYMDNGELITKENNYVNGTTIKYKKLLWASTDLSPSAVGQTTFTNLAGETVYLGGGVPVGESPSELTGKKLQFEWEVVQADGSAITTANDITVLVSDKQFVDGAVKAGATTLASGTINASASNHSGTFTSSSFNLAEKSTVWLNAYSSQKGYIVRIKNIDLR